LAGVEGERPKSGGCPASQNLNLECLLVRTPRSRSGGAAVRIPLIQGKEQQLQFAGAAMKRYPTSKVRETQVIW